MSILPPPPAIPGYEPEPPSRNIRAKVLTALAVVFILSFGLCTYNFESGSTLGAIAGFIAMACLIALPIVFALTKP